MSELERIRRDVRTELASGEDLTPEPDADFDRILEAALAGLDPTDEWIEAVDTLVEARALTATMREAAPTNALRKAQGTHPLDLAALRGAAATARRNSSSAPPRSPRLRRSMPSPARAAAIPGSRASAARHSAVASSRLPS